MLAQLSNSSALYANSTTNRQTMASIHIEKTGIYQVTILAVRHEDGILNSSVEYSTHLFVDINDAGGYAFIFLICSTAYYCS